jgi:hypothetical protein
LTEARGFLVTDGVRHVAVRIPRAAWQPYALSMAGIVTRGRGVSAGKHRCLLAARASRGSPYAYRARSRIDVARSARQAANLTTG